MLRSNPKNKKSSRAWSVLMEMNDGNIWDLSNIKMSHQVTVCEKKTPNVVLIRAPPGDFGWKVEDFSISSRSKIESKSNSPPASTHQQPFLSKSNHKKANTLIFLAHHIMLSFFQTQVQSCHIAWDLCLKKHRENCKSCPLSRLSCVSCDRTPVCDVCLLCHLCPLSCLSFVSCLFLVSCLTCLAYFSPEVVDKCSQMTIL